MTPEEIAKLVAETTAKTIASEFAKRDEAAKKAAEEAKKKAEEEAAKKKEEEDALAAAEKKVKERNQAKTQEELEKERMLNAFKFNSTLNDWLKTNKEFLPGNTEDIINILMAKQYNGDVDKAQELKRAIVEQYIKEQKNLDVLPEYLKAKAEKYAGLSTKEKLEQAENFYDIVETGINTAKNIAKVAAIEKGSGMSADKSAIEEYEEKMLEFSKSAVQESGNTNGGNGGK